MKKVISILLSTYNGQSYVVEQLESIFNQDIDRSKYELKVFVRDDKSSDQTVSVIEKYRENKKANIEFVRTKQNLGVVKSFFELIHDTRGDFFFFSDQDDIWHHNKISKFMVEFEKHNNKKPVGVFADAWVADERAQPTERKLLHGRLQGRLDGNILPLKSQVSEYLVQGANFAFNAASQEILKKINRCYLEYATMHDHLAALTISAVGSLYYLDEPLINYRQLQNNVMGARSENKDKFKLSLFRSRVQDVEDLFVDLHIVHVVLKTANILSNTVKRIDQVNYLGKCSFKRTINFLAIRNSNSASHPVIVSMLYQILFSPNSDSLEAIDHFTD
ncbi:hypothetical protein ATX59_07475 [Oenococcus oeni]|uniref:Glycosyltransferase 2-like domain-containing protein n=1 Tax=Oenococcus oeni TaxID=1247 RepID=A0A6N4A572_OENOE|nr:glycosyltransferase [Oenococcus oeni]OIM20749.1 hypothetical protein ATX59_07475 [Oenococcus oeni]